MHLNFKRAAVSVFMYRYPISCCLNTIDTQIMNYRFDNLCMIINIFEKLIFFFINYIIFYVNIKYFICNEKKIVINP